MTTRKVFITSTTNDNDKLNLEIVIDIPEAIVHADVDYWAKKKAIALFYDKYWTNTNYNRNVYEANNQAVIDALNSINLLIEPDLLAKIKNECKKVIRDHHGYTDIDGTYFSSLSLSGMINYLANTGTQVEVYIMPKKRFKEVVK
jgi:hypothetical protein